MAINLPGSCSVGGGRALCRFRCRSWAQQQVRIAGRPRFSREETGFECWQPRTAAIVQHHQYGQSEQLHRHLRSGRGSIYMFEGALDAQRRRQHEQVLVQRLPPCSFERALPPHPGYTGKQPVCFFLPVTVCPTELRYRAGLLAVLHVCGDHFASLWIEHTGAHRLWRVGGVTARVTLPLDSRDCMAEWSNV